MFLFLPIQIVGVMAETASKARSSKSAGTDPKKNLEELINSKNVIQIPKVMKPLLIETYSCEMKKLYSDFLNLKSPCWNWPVVRLALNQESLA